MPDPSSVVWGLGVDLSLVSTALAAEDINTGNVHVSRVQSKGSAKASLASKIERYRVLSLEIAAQVIRVNPALVAIEGAQFSTSKDTSMHRRAGVWWRVCDLITEAGIPVIEIPPSTVKKWGTGVGNAAKDRVLASAVRRWPDAITQNDEADAAWLADIATYILGGETVARTKARDAILAKVDLSDVAHVAGMYLL